MSRKSYRLAKRHAPPISSHPRKYYVFKYWNKSSTMIKYTQNHYSVSQTQSYLNYTSHKFSIPQLSRISFVKGKIMNPFDCCLLNSFLSSFFYVTMVTNDMISLSITKWYSTNILSTISRLFRLHDKCTIPVHMYFQQN